MNTKKITNGDKQYILRHELVNRTTATYWHWLLAPHKNFQKVDIICELTDGVGRTVYRLLELKGLPI